VAERQTQAA